MILLDGQQQKKYQKLKKFPCNNKPIFFIIKNVWICAKIHTYRRYIADNIEDLTGFSLGCSERNL
jgi:hypothetical protein